MRWTALVRFPAGEENFLLSIQSGMALGPTQPPVEWILGSLATRGNRQGREAARSPSPSVEVPNMPSLTSA
jgi:hypothetical protein